MSVKIQWCKVRPNTFESTLGGSRLYEILASEFGMPCTLGDKNYEFLRGVQAAGIPGAGELMEAIAEFGAINVRAEF